MGNCIGIVKPRKVTIKIDPNKRIEAQELISLLERWLPKRQNLIKILRGVAEILIQLEIDVNIAKVAGMSVAVAGGALAVGGAVASIFTAGIATPIVAAGVGLATTGGIIARGAEIAKHVIEKCAEDKVQEVLNENRDMEREFAEKYDRVDQQINDLLKTHPGINKDVLMRAVLCGSTTVMSQKIACRNVVDSVDQSMKSTIERLVALKGLRAGAGVAARNAAFFGLVAFRDIKDLVETSINLSNGNKSEAAKMISALATHYEETTDDLQTFLKDIK